MSFLTTVTSELTAAQTVLEGINSNLAAQNAGAASATTVVAPAAADAVSIQQAAIFSTYGTTYQTTATAAQTQLETYVTNLGTSANSYSTAESSNAASAVAQDLAGPVNAPAATATEGPGASLLDFIQYLLGGTGNNTNPTMLGGVFGLSSNGANIGNIGAGNWASAMSDLLGMAGGGLLPAGSDTIGDAGVAAALASDTTPMAAMGSGGMVGMGGMPMAMGMGQGTLVGNLAVPPSWAGTVTPVAAAAPLHTVGWTAAAPQAAAGTGMAGMPGMVTGGAGRSSAGFGAPRYGVKPIVMPKPATV
ncbi:PE family protein [Mycobacterium numidiamassiliense]|uniref:PE family protein n=1 Tax=Mycobacterium numidiamassiliense TaxID=1841861 RepID=A0A2U3PBM5_9MYCO|nr:PE/PPE C-terminal domain-containing protein [Mycobacterium numidiamassiliense]SPM41174.1 PE family protein [Mycobacterium numidiamassiliense]